MKGKQQRKTIPNETLHYYLLKSKSKTEATKTFIVYTLYSIDACEPVWCAIGDDIDRPQ